MQCGLLYLLTENGMPKQQGGLSVFCFGQKKMECQNGRVRAVSRFWLKHRNAKPSLLWDVAAVWYCAGLVTRGFFDRKFLNAQSSQISF